MPTVRPFEEWFIGADARRWVQALWWAVGCVLLIACVNVANLFILQAVGRSHEMSVRLALGAGRWRLVRVFVFESLLLSSLSGLVGLWVASQTMRLSQHLTTDFDALALELDRPVVVYLSAISVAVGLIAGLATATHLLRLADGGLTGASARTVAGNRREGRMFTGFVCVQMAVAVALLGSATVTLSSRWRAGRRPRRESSGVRDRLAVPAPGTLRHAGSAHGVLPAARRPPGGRRWHGCGCLRGRCTHRAHVARGCGSCRRRPRRPRGLSIRRVDRDRAGIFPCAWRLDARRTRRARRGRRGARARGRSEPPVRRRPRPGRSPLGERFRLRAESPGTPPGPWHIVVGVASNVVQDDRTRQATEPITYLAHAQHPQPNMFVFVRGRSATTLAAALRREIAAMDPALPVPALWPLELRLARGYALERNTTALLAIFAFVAVTLASTGLYAVSRMA